MRVFYIFFVLIGLFIQVVSGQSLTNVTPAADVVSIDNFTTNRSVAVDADVRTGKTVYVWTELDATGTTRDVYCSVYDKNGVRIVNSFRVNTATNNEQVHPAVRINQQDNSFVVAWSSKQNGTDYDIYVKKIRLDINNFNTSEVISSAEVMVNTITSLDQYVPRLAIDYARNELLVGFSSFESTVRDAYIRQFNYNSLQPVATQFLVHSSGTGDQYLCNLEVCSLNGELLAVYQQTPGVSAWDVYKRTFKYINGAYAGETPELVNAYTAGDQYTAFGAINQQTGSYTITWQSLSQDGSGQGTYAKIYNKEHTVIKAEFLVSSSTVDNQLNVKSVWDERTNYIFYFFHYSRSGFSTLRYRIMDNTMNFIDVEQSLLWNGAEINTRNYYSGNNIIAYHSQSRRLSVAYDLFDNFTTNSKACLRILEYKHPNLQPSSTCTTDVTKLWVEETTYDEFGNVVAQSRAYSDALGRTTQVQKRNITDNKIIAAAVVYDRQGRPVLQTLPAPISQTCFTYNDNFIATNSICSPSNQNCNPYSTAVFDLPWNSGTSGEINNPQPVGILGSALGNYYSDQNTAEPYIPESSYPYSRVDYNDRIVGGQTRSSGPVEAMRMGQGHESKTVVLPLLNELDNHYLEIRNSHYIPGGPSTLAWQGTKTISTDENGKETVAFHDKGGQLLARALSNGSTMTLVKAKLGPQLAYWNYTVPTGKKLTNLKIAASGIVDLYNFTTSVSYNGAADLHPFASVPAGNTIQVRYNQSFTLSYTISNTDGTSPVHYEENVAELQSKSVLDLYVKQDLNISVNAGVTFKIYDLLKGGLVTSVANTYSNAPGIIAIPAGLYRIRIEGVTNRLSYSPLELTIDYKFNYSEFSYVYYDDAGMPIREISPKGVDLTSIAEPLKYYSKYIYNTLGWKLSSFDSDRGLTEYVYQQDGQLRFSQDARQKVDNKFSYVNYKVNGDATEQGEYSTTTSSDHVFQNTLDIYNNVTPPSGVSVKNIIENTDGLDDVRCTSVNKTEMDVPDYAGLAALNGYVQRYTNRRISKSYNAQSTSWYSYDELGRMEWMVQNITGLGVKTIHYEYDALGNLKKSVYQKSVAQEFIHYWSFNETGSQSAQFTPDLSRVATGSVLYTAGGSSSISLTGNVNDNDNIGFLHGVNQYRNIPSSAHLLINNPAGASLIFSLPTTGYEGVKVKYVIKKSTPSQQEIVQYTTDGTNYTPFLMSYAVNVPQLQILDFSGIAAANNNPHFKIKITFGYLTGSCRIDNLSLSGTSTNISDERFEHRYDYNPDHSLSSVKTRTGKGNLQQEALYKYYQHGPLKRTELAEDLQGIDYVYTINGQLKSINHPTLDNAKDPGKDNSAGVNVGFAADVFGMQLQYFDGDYTRAGSNITNTTLASYSDQFNGNVKGIKWQVRGHSMSGSMLMYGFTYDQKDQLTNAGFGTVAPTSENTFTSSTAFGITNTYDVNGNLLTKNRKNATGINEDAFDYSYGSTPVDNKLTRIVEGGSIGRYYTYDASGKCTREYVNGNTVRGITYDVYDQVTEVKQYYTVSGTDVPRARFFYNERGQRFKKEVYVNGVLGVTTYYVRDASGNILSVYEKVSDIVLQTEIPIYGMSRLGEVRKNNGVISSVYELTDHLGTVRATIKRVKVTGPDGLQAEIDSWSDYYADGEVMPGRSGATGQQYRFGYQGQFAERDETNLNSFDLRMFDTEIGRWISPDPYDQYHSPYMAMGNNPVSYVDPDGGSDGPFRNFIIRFLGGNPTQCPSPGSQSYMNGSTGSSGGIGSAIGSFIGNVGSFFSDGFAGNDGVAMGGTFFSSPYNGDMGTPMGGYGCGIDLVAGWESARIYGMIPSSIVKAQMYALFVIRVTPYVNAVNIGDLSYHNTTGSIGNSWNVGTNGGEFGNGGKDIPLYYLERSKQKVFDRLWDNYKSKTHVDPLSGKDRYANGCAIRLSEALIGSGIDDMKKYKGLTCKHDGHSDCGNHARMAQELADYLLSRRPPGLNKPVFLTGANWEEYVKGKRGVIFFKDYWHRDTDKNGVNTGDHIDLIETNSTGEFDFAGKGWWSERIQLNSWLGFLRRWIGISEFKGSSQVIFWEME